MTRPSLPAILAFSLALGLAAPAAARSPIGIGVHGGYGESKGADSGSPRAGVHLEFRPADILGVVGAVDYQFDEDATVEAGDMTLGSYTVHSVPVSVMARLYLPMPTVRPYATAGASLHFVTYDVDDLEDIQFEEDSESAFGWLIGAGVQYDAGEKTGLFGEIRYEAIDADRDIDNAIEDVEEFEYDRWNVMAGVTFYF